ncbi:hypothetical protein E4656_05680 [Natronospirillum operosum]|uniref:Uncharacterized protein n=1 Tax=Natronospirillum operosum TaxID=2759953 RepID=A0A4Z0WH66_9GAMM|nr:hypothetical protein [Natronospirillum operosum]TGG95888.1 hypothetical protein E4656_05680 [Natronospirillum operosum]
MPDQAHPGVFWRIVDESGIGPDSVTLVFETAEAERKALQLETDIVTAEFLSHAGKDHVDVAWTQDDFDLLQVLLRKQFPERFDDEEMGFHLDLNDESVLDTLAVIAAARFSAAQKAEDWLLGHNWVTVQRAYEVGDMVALATDAGFCLGVVVALDAVEAEVVLLECIDPKTAEPSARLHELVRVYKADLLPDTFGHVMTTDEDTLH